MREFSVHDALQHFAWIYEMSDEKFRERYQFLEKLLELPPSSTRVKNLSGGQQRRTSLAVSLVNISTVYAMQVKPLTDRTWQ